MRDPIWDGTDQDLWIVSGSFGKELQESTQAGCVIGSHVSLVLLAGSLESAGSTCLIDAGPNLGLDRSRFVDCIRQFWKIIARVHASGLCDCKSRVSSSARRQLGDRGVHVLS